MQVEDVGCGGTRLAQGPRPGGDQMLVGRVVDGGEDPVGCAGAVLVGRVQWGVSAQRVGGRERSGVVDGRDVKPAEEQVCITWATRQPEGTRDDGHIPPLPSQRMGQPACHLRRATTREEHETHHHARSGQCCYGHGHLLLMRRVCWSLPRRRATSEGSALVSPPLQDLLAWGIVQHELGCAESWHGRAVGSFPLTMWLLRKYKQSKLSPQEKPRQMGKEGYTINT
jgi:hypothetical protein